MKTIRFTLHAVALSAALLTAVPAPVAFAMTQSEVEEGLTCQCGCGLTVRNCNHTQCGFSIPVREDIAASLTRGESGEEILARYAEEYGEKVLSSPVPEGFNILAWVGPYLSIVLGGLGLAFTIRRWARKKDGGEGSPPTSPPVHDEKSRRRLDSELESMDV